MDFGEVLTRAWKIIWRFKILWIFGILAGCGQGGGNGGGGGGGSVSSSINWSEGNPDFQLPPGWERFFIDVGHFFENIRGWQIAAILAGAILVSLVFWAIVLALNTIGRIGLVQGTLKAENGAETLTFGELFEEGKPFFWRILGFNLLIGLAFLLVAMLIFVPIALFGIVTIGLGFVCALPLICMLVPLTWAATVVIEQANIAIIVEELSMSDGLKRGWEVFRENIGAMIVMMLILFFGQFVIGFVLALPRLRVVLCGLYTRFDRGKRSFDGLRQDRLDSHLPQIGSCSAKT
jgi:hypothetical protein